MPLLVTALADETDGIRVLTVVAADGGNLPDWEPGAHVTFQTPAGDRSCSLIRWPEPTKGYRFGVQREGGGGSACMHVLKVGDTVEASPRRNDFALGIHANMLPLARRIRVTPLISKAGDLNYQTWTQMHGVATRVDEQQLQALTALNDLTVIDGALKTANKEEELLNSDAAFGNIQLLP